MGLGIFIGPFDIIGLPKRAWAPCYRSDRREGCGELPFVFGNQWSCSYQRYVEFLKAHSFRLEAQLNIRR